MDVIINARLDNAPVGTTAITHQGDFYHHLLCCFGHSVSNPPVADLLRRYHHLEGEWLVVSPIHWQATHNDAMIMASGSELELSEGESRLWFAAFAEFIASEQMKLHYHDATTWLLQCEGRPPLKAEPAHVLLQKSMTPQLRKLDDTLFWQRFITESQMFFSAHSLNSARLVCPINGVWFWGNGTIAPIGSIPLVCDTKMHELATLLSTQVSSYHLSQTYTKDSIVLLHDLNVLDLQVLQSKLQKYTVRWYWNNLAYTSKPKSWLSRIWR